MTLCFEGKKPTPGSPGGVLCRLPWDFRMFQNRFLSSGHQISHQIKKCRKHKMSLLSISFTSVASDLTSDQYFKNYSQKTDFWIFSLMNSMENFSCSFLPAVLQVSALTPWKLVCSPFNTYSSHTNEKSSTFYSFRSWMGSGPKVPPPRPFVWRKYAAPSRVNINYNY